MVDAAAARAIHKYDALGKNTKRLSASSSPLHYFSFYGNSSPEDWDHIVRVHASPLRLRRGQAVFESGAAAGAFDAKRKANTKANTKLRPLPAQVVVAVAAAPSDGQSRDRGVVFGGNARPAHPNAWRLGLGGPAPQFGRSAPSCLSSWVQE